MNNQNHPAPAQCPICSETLGDIEIALHRPYHFECRRCAYCQEQIPSDEIIGDCISKGYPVSHHGCRERALITEIKDKTIPVTQAHIDILNRDILRFMDVPPDTSDIAQLTSLIKSVTELAANVSFVFSHVSQRVRVQDIRKGERELRASEGERLLSKRSEEAARIQRQTEKANPEIRERRKAIEGFMKMTGMSLEQASTIVDSMKTKPPQQ